MMVVKCLVFAASTGLFAFFLGRLFPKRLLHYSAAPFRDYRWEKGGRFYEKLGIRRWKNLLPDMSRVFPKLMQPKRIDAMLGSEEILCMIEETCVAEAVHVVLCIVGLVLIRLWRGLGGIVAWLLYALLGNLPFIMIQRYNRPRYVEMLKARQSRARRVNASSRERRLLILSCDTGEGHNACGRAIRECYETHGWKCEQRDALRFLSPLLSRAVVFCHVHGYRHAPGSFRAGYAFAERHPALLGEKSLVGRLMASGAEHLYCHMLDGGYSHVISTHVISAYMLSDMLKRYSLKPRTGFVATDYTCSPIVRESELDWYFVPDAALTQDFVCDNIPKERTVPSGIPVNATFYARGNAQAAKESLGIPSEDRHILMMGGSMGCGDMRGIAAQLYRRLPDDVTLTVVCGSNRRLERRLRHKYRMDLRIRVLGYANNMSQLMDSADLFITKPGGLSTTEAAAKGLPMVLIDAVGGCEDYNARFMERAGIAVSARKPVEIARIATELIQSPSLLERMRLSATLDDRPAEIIYHYMDAA